MDVVPVRLVFIFVGCVALVVAAVLSEQTE
jgi:hypothetical protein